MRDFYGEDIIFIDEGDSQIGEPSTDCDNENNIFISVLTDRLSMSSSRITGEIVQDGKLGNVIGEPSANAANSFGGMIPFYTPILNLPITISHMWFMRPDINADQTTLIPDILVPAEEALDTALEFLRGLERGQ